MSDDREERTRRIIPHTTLRSPGYLVPQSDYQKAAKLYRLQEKYKHHAPPNLEVVKHHSDVRSYCLDLALILEGIVPDGSEKEVMHQKLEEVMFWANAGIARQKDAKPD